MYIDWLAQEIKRTSLSSFKGVLVKGAKISDLLSFVDIGSFGPFEYTPLLVASNNRKSKNAEHTANCTRTVFKLDICIRMVLMSTLATIWSVLCTYTCALFFDKCCVLMP